MAYDEALAQRVRRVLEAEPEVREQKMFGGLAFMVRGHMACGLREDTLIVRIDPETQAAAEAEPHAGPMDFTGRALRGFVVVQPEGIAGEAALGSWIARALDRVRTLPPKPSQARKTKRTRRTAAGRGPTRTQTARAGS